MAGLIGAAIGQVSGGVGGALANQREGGKSAQNMYDPVINQMGGVGGLGQVLSQAMNAQQVYGGDPTKELQNNSVLGGLFGQGGTMDRTNQEEQQLASQGFNLTPEDRTAYGQASGDIARQFGESDQSLANALSQRGLSNSGAAGAAFSGSQGNKMEQLAKAQTDIAQKRFQSNLQRLGQTRQFLGQLGQQGQSGINEMQQLGREKAGDYNQVLQNKANLAMGLLGGSQGQRNEGLQQEQQTEHASNLSNIWNGGMKGASEGAKMGSGMGGSGGGGGMS